MVNKSLSRASILLLSKLERSHSIENDSKIIFTLIKDNSPPSYSKDIFRKKDWMSRKFVKIGVESFKRQFLGSSEKIQNDMTTIPWKYWEDCLDNYVISKTFSKYQQDIKMRIVMSINIMMAIGAVISLIALIFRYFPLI